MTLPDGDNGRPGGGGMTLPDGDNGRPGGVGGLALAGASPRASPGTGRVEEMRRDASVGVEAGGAVGACGAAGAVLAAAAGTSGATGAGDSTGAGAGVGEDTTAGRGGAAGGVSDGVTGAAAGAGAGAGADGASGAGATAGSDTTGAETTGAGASAGAGGASASTGGASGALEGAGAGASGFALAGSSVVVVLAALVALVALTGLGSSGCSSRIRPSRAARRRTMSQYASCSDDEWLLAAIPRSWHKSRVSLFVIPSSFASSCNRMFFATFWSQPFAARQRSVPMSSGLIDSRASEPTDANALVIPPTASGGIVVRNAVANRFFLIARSRHVLDPRQSQAPRPGEAPVTMTPASWSKPQRTSRST
jgi:hypothetical protein